MNVDSTTRVPGFRGAYLSIETRLYLDLPSEIQLFRPRFGPLVPFFKDLPKSGRVDLDELLQAKTNRSVNVRHLITLRTLMNNLT